jgi:hypothetical protein
MPSVLFSEILAKGVRAGHIPARTKAAREWYRETAMATRGITATKLYKQSADMYHVKITIGSLYCFAYDAKHKGTLPFWDKFPMVFPFAPAEDGFYGLNLHYLPYQLRAVLMDGLYTLTNNKKFDQSTKLRLTYKSLVALSKTKYFEPCVHRYLTGHVMSKFVKVDPVDWETAVFLPVESFVGAKKTIVWKDSRRRVGL